jgi:hypothetical protein
MKTRRIGRVNKVIERSLCLLALALEGPFWGCVLARDVARFPFLGEERCGARCYGEHRIPQP